MDSAALESCCLTYIIARRLHSDPCWWGKRVSGGVSPSAFSTGNDDKLNLFPKLSCEGEFLVFICRCCYTSLTTHAQDLVPLRSAECISVTPGSAPLLDGSRKWQMHRFSILICGPEWADLMKRKTLASPQV